MAFIRGKKYSRKLSDLPSQDRLALVLIGGIVLVGFILEGVRIAMTGRPPGSGFAFAGYELSLLLAGSYTNQIFGYLWYLHAILAGLFIAYLPFSRLLHIIMAPVVLAMRAVSEQERKRHSTGKGV